MERSPVIVGTMFAALAALAFGVTTPFIQRLGVGVGPFTTAALLYLGEAIFTVVLAALIHREHVGRRVALAVALMFAGGVVTVAGASSTGSCRLLGALCALALGDRPGGVTTPVAALLFVGGLALHLTERHRHDHRHEALEHEH